MMTNQKIAHCGFCAQPMDLESSLAVDDQYCCSGCQTADALIHGEGTTGPDRATLSKYEHLSVASDAEGLRKYDEHWYSWELELPHIHCTSCLILLERMPEWLDGVHELRVSFSAKRAHIYFDTSIVNPAVLAAWLDYVGYPPKLVGKTKRDRSLIINLGIAGFAMGNAMMGAFPEYFGLSESSDANLLHFFRYSTALFATLSLFTAGRFYLVSALKSLSAKTWSLDVPIAIGMLMLWGWSSYLLFNGISGGYFDSLAGLVFFLLLGRFLQTRTYSAFSFERTIKDFLPLSIYSEDQRAFVRLEDLKLGENVHLPEGGIIPVDLFLKAPAVVDYSFITGESDPVSLGVNEVAKVGGKSLDDIHASVHATPSVSSLEQVWKAKDQTTGWVSARLTAIFTISVLSIAFFSGIAWYYINPDRFVEIAVSVLIIACPCALSLAAPFAYGTARSNLAKLGLYLKEGKGIIDLSTLRNIAWDKTGTLTQKHPKASIHWEKGQHPELLFALASRSTHPISQAISKALTPSYSVVLGNWQESVGEGIRATTEYGTVLKLGSGKWLGLLEGPTYFFVDDILVATISVSAAYRDGMAEVFEALSAAQIDHHLISGDQPKELPTSWTSYFSDKSHFNQNPAQKAALLRTLPQTAFIGDGLNDIQAMHEAQIGLSVVEEDLGYFPQSDGILMSDGLSKLPAILRYSRRMVLVVRSAYLLSLLYNLLGVVIAVSGLLSPVIAAVLMPLSSITVVLFVVLLAQILQPKN